MTYGYGYVGFCVRKNPGPYKKKQQKGSAAGQLVYKYTVLTNDADMQATAQQVFLVLIDLTSTSVNGVELWFSYFRHEHPKSAQREETGTAAPFIRLRCHLQINSI